jgi:hypothetical protein
MSRCSRIRSTLLSCQGVWHDCGGLLFLQHLHLYNNHLSTLPLTNVYCDNEGLVKKVNKICSFCLAWLPQLCTLSMFLVGLPSPPIIAHVKEHQDNTVKYQDRPLPAQLSCDVGILATHELAESPTRLHVNKLSCFQRQKSNSPLHICWQVSKL